MDPIALCGLAVPPIAEILLRGFCTSGIYGAPLDELYPTGPRFGSSILFNLAPPVVVLFLEPILLRGTDMWVR